MPLHRDRNNMHVCARVCLHIFYLLQKNISIRVSTLKCKGKFSALLSCIVNYNNQLSKRKKSSLTSKVRKRQVPSCPSLVYRGVRIRISAPTTNSFGHTITKLRSATNTFLEKEFRSPISETSNFFTSISDERTTLVILPSRRIECLLVIRYITVGMRYFIIEGKKIGISKLWTRGAIWFFLTIMILGYVTTVYLLGRVIIFSISLLSLSFLPLLPLFPSPSRLSI